MIHFEALGAEARQLERETRRAVRCGDLPPGHVCLIVPESVQAFLLAHPGTVRPPLITIKTHSEIPAAHLRCGGRGIVTRSAGYDHVEHLAKHAAITSLREYCVNAVAQTAIKFLYAAAGKLNHYAALTASFDRRSATAFSELGKHLTLTVFGVGKIGGRIAELAAANGLTVQGVDLRQAERAAHFGNTVRFVSKETALRSSHIIVNAMNLTRSRRSRFFNVGYFSRESLQQTRKGLIFINVTRGEIAPESVLLERYQSGQIAGLGLDVFTREAEFATLFTGGDVLGEDLTAARTLVDMALNRTGNVYVQPHQAFHSDLAVKAKAAETIKHLASWYRNNCTRFDDQLPYS